MRQPFGRCRLVWSRAVVLVYQLRGFGIGVKAACAFTVGMATNDIRVERRQLIGRERIDMEIDSGTYRTATIGETPDLGFAGFNS